MKFYSFIVFLFILPSAFAQKSLDALLNQYNTRSIPYISVEELRMHQFNSDVIILDTRESEEFEISHIAGAQPIGFNQFSIDKISAEIVDKETPIVVYCSLGIRSEEIGEKLIKAGYTNVKNLYGGIFEWKNKAYPVLNSQNKETDSVHTFSKTWSKWLLKGVKVYNTETPN
jgi:rhodanese-related sulfurtransferase